jgi:hypothetical protein
MCAVLFGWFVLKEVFSFLKRWLSITFDKINKKMPFKSIMNSPSEYSFWCLVSQAF